MHANRVKMECEFQCYQQAFNDLLKIRQVECTMSIKPATRYQTNFMVYLTVLPYKNSKIYTWFLSAVSQRYYYVLSGDSWNYPVYPVAL